MKTPTKKVIIIGSGPYGVSIANELFCRGIDFSIVGKPFSLWFEHTQDTMAVRSDWHTSEIYSPDKRFDFRTFLQRSVPDRAREIVRNRIPIDLFRGYLDHVKATLPYPIEDTLVTGLKRTSDGFEITCDNGKVFNSAAVIVATGIQSHRYLPPALRRLPGSKVIHTWHVLRFRGISGKRILVVGAGQSAAEAISALSAGNEVSWLLRHRPVFYNEPINLPTPIFNFFVRVSPVYFFIPRLLKKPLARRFIESTITPDHRATVMGPAVIRLQGDVETLALSAGGDGPIHSGLLGKKFDYIIAATGYRYTLDSMHFLHTGLRKAIAQQGGVPRLSFRFETSVPNLFMVGGIAEPSHGPTLRFIMGTYHAAKGIGAIAGRFAG